MRQARNFDHLLGQVKGLSDKQLSAHFELYRRYVDKFNQIQDTLGRYRALAYKANYVYSDYSELKRREPVAFNGMILHEHYFDNIGNGSTSPSRNACTLLGSSFGTVEAWRVDAKACLMSGYGWLLTVYNAAEDCLFNNLVRSEHDVGTMANCSIIIAIDAWEHSYCIDYATSKERYVDEVLSGLEWAMIDSRIIHATQMAVL